MKKFMRAMLFCFPMYASAFCQVIDTMYIPNIYIMPGTTVALPIILKNNSFAVGGLTLNIQLADSSQATFVSIARGADFTNFEYYYTSLTAGSLRLAAVADMPGTVRTSPLPIGTHQIGFINVAVASGAPVGMSSQVLFITSGALTNAISDSTGFEVINPQLVNGNIIFASASITENNQPLATQFELSDNYPNPFNSRTNISFEIKEAGPANLDIYDIMGRRIATLTNEILSPGEYTFTWAGRSDNGKDMPSGAYFYKLSMAGVSETKKMCYLK